MPNKPSEKDKHLEIKFWNMGPLKQTPSTRKRRCRLTFSGWAGRSPSAPSGTLGPSCSAARTQPWTLWSWDREWGAADRQTDKSKLGDFEPSPLVHRAGCIYNGCSVWPQQITAWPTARQCVRIYTTGSIFRQHHVFRGNPLIMKSCLMNYRVCQFSYQKDQVWGQRLIQWSFVLLVTLNVMCLLGAGGRPYL